MRHAWRASLVLAGAGAVLSCGTSRHLLVHDPPARIAVDELIRGAPLAAGENIHPKEIRRGQSMSVHLVRIRDREQPHVHTRYDLAVVLVGGTGTLWLAGKRLPMREGDLAVIPKGTPHFFVNEGGEPASALVMFSPPFDGPDQSPVP